MTNREIDELIAEKVMEWAVRGPHPLFAGMVYATGQNDTMAPHFSTDISPAWMVLDRLKDEWIVTMEIDSHGTSIGLGKNYASTPIELRAHADTAPMAISLIALEAVGVEVTEARG